MVMDMLLVVFIRQFVLILLALLYGITALKDVSVNIPIAAKIDDKVTLQCSFDLEEELLYTLKWYKGSKEFYRYIPKELPNTRTFDLPGINVDISRSNHTNLVLTNVQPETTGKYKCEVSTDAPNFYTMMRSGYLYVIDIPTDDPILVMEKDFVEIGYILRGNCTTPPSFPRANITWYLNDQKINESYGRIIPSENTKTLPSTTKRIPVMASSSIEIEIDDAIFSSGKARFTCVANIFDMYKKKKEVVVEEDRPRPRPSSVLGNRDTSAGFALLPSDAIISSLFCFQLLI